MKILLDKIMYEKELSVRQVSIATGISKSTISRIMCGSVSPTMDVMECIAEGLKIHISDLYDSSFK
jgi:transcriptional regulator with XRE-family HTH domain